MKMAKKLAAVLLAGVLALSVLTACSGSAGPLTKDNVTDYIIDYYKTNGYQAEEEQSMESAAQAVLAYVNSQIGRVNITAWRFERHSRLLSRMRTKILEKGG